ncbi:MAG: hypothetical protein Kow0063_43450 [Anaerolineae bacterium]
MDHMSSAHRSARETLIPLRIAGLYALVGGLWILVSDRLLTFLIQDPQVVNRLQTFKGWLYVLATAILIYILVKRDILAISRTEQALRSSEARFQSIFRAAPVGIGVVSNRILLQVNDRICEMTGYTRQELVGQSARLLYPTDDDFDEVGREKYAQIRAQGTGSIETRWRRKDGQIINILLSSTPLDLDDLSAGVTFTALDITARVQAERDLRHSQLQYQTLAEHAPVGIWHAGPEGRVGYVNPTLMEITGLTPETAQGDGWMDALHPEDRQRVFEEWSAFIQGQAAFHTTCRFQQPDGTLRWVIGQAASARGPDGKPIAFIGTFTDITGRVQVEQALRQYSHRLRLLHESDQAILAARSAEEIGRAALEHLQELIPYRVASVIMFDFEAHESTILATYPEKEHHLLAAGLHLPLDPPGVSPDPLNRRDLRVVEDIMALPHPTPIEKNLLAEGVRSYISVPLVAQDELIGSLNLAAEGPGAWQEEHLDIAREVADSLAVAIQSARLIEAERARLMRESTLLSLASVAGSTLDLDVVMTTVLDSLRQLISCDTATIQLLEDDTLRTAAALGFEDGSPARTFVYPLEEYPLNRQLVEERLPIRIDDVELDDRYRAVPGVTQTRAFVGAPLLVRGQPVGVITAGGRQPGQFADYDVDLMAAVATHAAITVENARLFAETRWRAERMTALYEAMAAINRAITITDAFTAIRQQVIAMLPDALPPIFGLLEADGHSLVPHIMEPESALLVALRQATGLDLRDLRFSFQRARPETRTLLEAGQPYISDDPVSSLSHSIPEHLLRWIRDTLGMRGMTAMPFVVEGRLLGLMLILSPRRLAQEDLEPLTIFANQAAIVLDRIRLFEEVRAGREQLRELADYLQNAREEERTLIAREIHDEFGQALTALKIDLAWVRSRLPEGQTALKEKTTSMLGLIDDAIHLVRRIATELRPGLLDDLGLTAAIEWQAGEFAERTGIDCELHLGDHEIVHDQNLATTLFRILQEALTNVARHAKADRVRIDLIEEPDAVTLIVHDDGVGITQEQVANRASLGLVGIRERVRFWDGQVTFEGAPGQGTTVTVRMPKPG